MQWEYHTLKLTTEGTPGVFNRGGEFDAEELDRRMNKLGRHGWELVGGFDTNYLQGATRHLVLLFKRQRIDTVLPAEESAG